MELDQLRFLQKAGVKLQIMVNKTERQLLVMTSEPESKPCNINKLQLFF